MQNYNDLYRERGVWSLYGGIGVGGFGDLRNGENTDVAKYPTPDVYAGGSVYIFPYLRVGGSIGFNYIQSYATATNYGSWITYNYMLEGKPTTMTTKWATLMDSNTMPTFRIGADVEFNPLNIWMKDRKLQEINLWVGTGLGYMYGNNYKASSMAFKEQAYAKGDDYFHVYEHSYIRSEGKNYNVNQLVIPFKAAVEYDIFPFLTVGVQGEVNVLPINVKYSPVCMGSASINVRYNFLGGRYKSYKTRYEESCVKISDLEAEIAALKARKPEVKEVEKIVYKEVIKEVVKEVITSENLVTVYFRQNSTGLSTQAKSAINQLVARLKANPDMKIKSMVASANTIGGTKSANKRTSEKRMNEVVKYLKESGISSEMLSKVEKHSIGDEGMSADVYCCRVIIVTE